MAFDWKYFINNREAQAAAAALAATSASRLAGLGWAPSLGLGAFAGGTLWGGRTLWDRYKETTAADEQRRRSARTLTSKFLHNPAGNLQPQTSPGKNLGGKYLSALEEQRLGLLNSNSTSNPIYPGSKYGVQSLYSSDPKIANAAWRDYDGKLTADRAAQERDYIRKVQESDALYDVQDAEQQSRLSDELARRDAAYKASQERRRRAAEIAFGEREQAIEDEVMDTDRRLQEEYDARATADAQYDEPYYDPDGSLEEDYERMNNEIARKELTEQSELRRADVRRRVALAERLRRYDEANQPKPDWYGVYGRDPYIMSSSDAFAQTTGLPFIWAANKVKQGGKAVADIFKGAGNRGGAEPNAERNAVLGGITAALVRAKTDRKAAGDILIKIQDKVKNMPPDIQKKYYSAVKQILL